MHIIRNAIVYSADLPGAQELSAAIESLRFSPITELQASSVGFIETDVSPDLVAKFEGGLSIALRIDEKVLPAGPVKQAKREAVELATAEAGHDLDKGRIAEIHEEVMVKLVASALTKTTMVRAFYWPADKLLIVATSSERNARAMMSQLIKACESVKTTTIHVDGVRFGLTAHLRNHLENLPKDFGLFNIGDSVVLKNEHEKIVFDVQSLDHARDGLIEAIAAGMHVEKLELEHGTVSFMLNAQFRFSKITFFGDEAAEAEDVAEDVRELWARTAHIEVSQLAAAIRELCVVFSRQTDIEIDAPQDPQKDHSEESDTLYPDAMRFVRDYGRVSPTALQRAFKIGYDRAARLIEKMESDGIVSPMSYNGARTVIG